MTYNAYNKAYKRSYNNFNNYYGNESTMKYNSPRNTPSTAKYHCPIILILDTSHTMWGKGKVDIEWFMQGFFNELSKKLNLSCVIDIAAISMGNNFGMLEDFTPFKKSSLPLVNICPKGDAPLGGALNLALRKLDAQENYYNRKGIKYVPPQMIVLTDGDSYDDHSFAVNRVQNRVTAGILQSYTIAVGNTPNMRTLYQVGQLLNIPGDPAQQASYAATKEVCRHYAKNAPKPPANVRPQAGGQHNVEYVIDGTNIMFCQHQKGVLARVLGLVDELDFRSIPFCVFFDASTRHHLNNNAEIEIYNHLIANDSDRFIEVPGGTQADDYILAYTRDDSRRKVITRDRYRDYTPKYGAITERVIPCVCANNTLLLPEINMEIPVPTITNK